MRWIVALTVVYLGALIWVAVDFNYWVTGLGSRTLAEVPAKEFIGWVCIAWLFFGGSSFMGSSK